MKLRTVLTRITRIDGNGRVRLDDRLWIPILLLLMLVTFLLIVN